MKKPKPKTADHFVVVLKRPVKLPISFLDAIKKVGIKEILVAGKAMKP